MRPIEGDDTKLMGRRSVHSPEELRQLILDASKSIVERNGIAGLSAREIARLIGYSPGTLYNIFENLDDVLLTLQLQLAERTVEHLKAVPLSGDGTKDIAALTTAYVSFALDNRRLWNLLFAHSLPAGINPPPGLQDQFNSIVQTVKTALAPSAPHLSDEQLEISARTLWAGVYGITALAVTDKGRNMTTATVQLFANHLTSTFLKGLTND